MIKFEELYNAITNFSLKYGCRQFNNEENMNEYMKLVDMSIECGRIPKCNRREFSTHAELAAAIAYESNRIAFCK